MFSTTDTIVAIATPPGRGGIGVVRLSGAGRRTRSRGALIARDRAARAAPRDVHMRRASTTLIDQVVATYFPAPHSYTGDDVVELSAHGSPVVLRGDRRRRRWRRARGSPSRASSRCARF